MVTKQVKLSLYIAVLLSLIAAGSAEATWKCLRNFDQGQWRGEIGTTSFGTNQFPDNTGDWMVIGSVEYEWAYLDKTTLGLKGYPFLIYYQDNNGRGKSDYIYAAGIAANIRYYQNAIRSEGWYAEAAAGPIINSEYFEDNGCSVNFLLDGGIGYQFDNNITLAVKYYHISNGGLDNRNIPLDMVGFSVGYQF